MYETGIYRPSANRKPQFSIRLTGIKYDERVAYIESVCATLIESRFGPGRPEPFVIDRKESPECESEIFCDLTVGGPFPCYADSEFGSRHTANTARRKLIQARTACAPPHAQSLSPSTLGRGSPDWSASIPACDAVENGKSLRP